MSLFHKILIANRGEIACRIIKTAKKLGILTVAVYSESDAKSLHVTLADEAFCIGPSPSSSSYLNYTKIINIAELTQAEAIHPGYGFLSENAEFAEICKKTGIVFIGPSPQSIRTMGEKHLAKEIMKKNHIPVLPDYYSETQTNEDLCQAAENIGFPILIKAVAGGGGKGLRRVHNMSDFESNVAAAKREAKASFSDERVMLEKYLDPCRHIEVQIIADQHDNVVHLFERDCSIQRKHQKIIEEAPALHMNPALKQNLYQAAVNAAKSIHYLNAGTVEFLVTENEYFFMEMNTRLQVEHPITEMITGIDIVEWQFRVACGEKLPIPDQSNITCQGHAIEARLNAEDPSKNFMPATGTLDYVKMPTISKSVRIDTGFREKDTISIYYDSLIAKLIVHAKNRSQAIKLLQKSLHEIEIAGLTTNLFLLKNIVDHETYQIGNFATQFLETHSSLLEQNRTFTNEAIIIASLAVLFQEKISLEKTHNFQADPNSPWFSRHAWRLNLPAKLAIQLEAHEKTIAVEIIHFDDYLEFVIQEKVFKVSYIQQHLKNSILSIQLQINDAYHLATIFISDENYYVYLRGEEHIFHLLSKIKQSQYQAESGNHLLAPMPGTIVDIMVNTGQKVIKGDKLLVIEAMKMEHVVYAPHDGLVKKCHYMIGDSINEGSELLEIASPEKPLE